VISHLWYTEPSNFIFAHLESKTMKKFCTEWNSKKSRQNILKDLLVILSHLFNHYENSGEYPFPKLEINEQVMISNFNKMGIELCMKYLKTFTIAFFKRLIEI
jgi:hypothetical protein